MSRIVYRIREGAQLTLEEDGRYRVQVEGDERVMRLDPPALAPALMVDGWRSDEEIEHALQQRGAPLPVGLIGWLLEQMVLAGIVERVQTPWRPLQVQSWPEHRCQGCGACCQGHWIGPLDPEFVARTAPRMPELRKKYPRLEGQRPFMQLDRDDRRLYLNSSSGQCIFLDDDLLCILHKEFGSAEKPTICQVFPYVRFEDEGQTRLGVGLMCLKHFDQVVDGDAPAQDGYWEGVHDALDGQLFHFYTAEDALETEERLLAELARADDPLLVALEALEGERGRPVRGKIPRRLEHLARRHLTRLEKALADDETIVTLAQREGLLVRRMRELRRLAAGDVKGPGGRPLVANARAGRTPMRRRMLQDALSRWVFLRQYLMFHNLAHGLAAFAVGLWTCLALTRDRPDDDRLFGEYLATWMRAVQAPSVRRNLFKTMDEVREVLTTFRQFWR